MKKTQTTNIHMYKSQIYDAEQNKADKKFSDHVIPFIWNSSKTGKTDLLKAEQ